MITTLAALELAKQRWIGPGGSADLFDKAIRVLDSAICHADVKRLLTDPPYTVVSPGIIHHSRPHVYTIWANSDFMLEYTLREIPPDADVEIVR